jgi:flagellar M-ring protein FliF
VAEWFLNLLAQFNALPSGRRIALVITAGGSMAFFFWLATDASKADYRLLFRGLEETETAKVITALESEKIPYRIEEAGTAIYVPAPLVFDARIRIAGQGLPLGNSIGFEIFDNAKFGVTDFVQKINYQRAVQGELARSIQQLDAVERARVQLALTPRTRLLQRNSEEGSASVVVRLRPGSMLTEQHVQAIMHLVASSVPYLEANRVTVVDTQGRLLGPAEPGSPSAGGLGGSLAKQKSIESEYARRIEAILEPTIGRGRVVARVHAELDWTQREQTEEAFDPDSQVARSEQRTTEDSLDGSGSPAGVPGIRSNAPGGTPGSVGSERTQSAKRSSETINYEISKIVSRKVESVGTVKRLNIAVIIDGKPTAAPAEGEKAAEPQFIPWSVNEIAQFEALSRRAVGFSKERGDEITLTSAPFRSIDIGDEGGGGLDPQMLALLGTVLNYLGLIIVAVLFARLVARPIITSLTSNTGASFPMNAGALEAALEGQGQIPAGAQPEAELSVAEQVGALSDARSEDSVKALRGWLDQRE